MAPRIPEDLQFTIEEWDDDGLVEILGREASLLPARAAFEATVQFRPGRRILLCQRARIIAESAMGSPAMN